MMIVMYIEHTQQECVAVFAYTQQGCCLATSAFCIWTLTQHDAKSWCWQMTPDGLIAHTVAKIVSTVASGPPRSESSIINCVCDLPSQTVSVTAQPCICNCTTQLSGNDVVIYDGRQMSLSIHQHNTSPAKSRQSPMQL